MAASTIATHGGHRADAIAAPPGVDGPPAATPTVHWPFTIGLVVAGLAASWLIAFGSRAAVVVGFGLLLGGVGALLAGYSAFSLVVALLVVRSSLDWFVASQSGGGITPVNGIQPAVVTGGAVLVVACTWLVVQAAAGELRRPSPPAVALTVFALTCLVTSLGASNPVLSVTTSLRVLTGAVLLLMVEQLLIRQPQRVWTMLAAMVAALAVPTVLSAVQLATRTTERNFVYGTFVNKNTMAIWLSVLIPMFVCAIRYLRPRLRLLTGAAVAVASAMLLFTYCRSAWIGVVLALLLIGLLQERVVLAMVVIAAFTVWAWVPSAPDRFSDLDNTRIEGQGDPNSFAFRQRYWHQILAEHVVGVPAIQNVTGIGLGMVEATDPSKLEPHNVWVQVLAETGALGTITFTVFVGTTAVTLYGAIRRTPKGPQRALLIGSAAAAANLLVQSASQNLITEAVIWSYFATVLAIGTSVALSTRYASSPSSRSTNRPG